MRLPPIIAIAALLLVSGVPLHAAEPTQAQKDQWAREYEERLHNDWPFLARYHDANAALPPKAAGRPQVVFMGDSITENWVNLVPGFFAAERAGPEHVGRGISGQTTPQMVARFRQDVIALRPDVVQIMAGTNDVAGNTGPITDAETEANIRTMVELAQAHGIRVILASIPPAAAFPWKPQVRGAGEHIMRLNSWLEAYARRTGSVYADYWGATHQGVAFHEGWSSDGVHPNATGYGAMAPVAEAAIRRALARPAPRALAIAE